MLNLKHGNASVAFECTDQECNIEEISDDDEAPAKSSKDKKSNGPDSGKASNLIFKITSKVPYKTVMKGNRLFQFMNPLPPLPNPSSDLNNVRTVSMFKMHFAAQSAVLLKAESMADKAEWINKLRNVAQSKGGQVIGEQGFPLRQSLSDGSLVSIFVRLFFSFTCFI